MQDWYREKRDEVEKVFESAALLSEGAQSVLSPSGRYSLEITCYRTGPNSWPFSKGRVYSRETNELIAEVRRNFGHFPFSWAERHPTGHDYLITGEDYQGQTIIELDTGTRIDFISDRAERGFGFCWTAHYPSPDGRFLFVDGCIWAAPYELILFDFSHPLDLPYREIDRWPVWKVDGFQPDGSFIWQYEAEYRKTDGKRTEEMSEEELDAFEEDPGYDNMLGEKSVVMKWFPDGHAEIIDELESSE